MELQYLRNNHHPTAQFLTRGSLKHNVSDLEEGANKPDLKEKRSRGRCEERRMKLSEPRRAKCAHLPCEAAKQNRLTQILAAIKTSAVSGVTFSSQRH